MNRVIIGMLCGVVERRVIDILREKFPDATAWAYDAKSQRWCNTDGWYVYRCAMFDDDIGHYRRSDTLEIVRMF